MSRLKPDLTPAQVRALALIDAGAGVVITCWECNHQGSGASFTEGLPHDEVKCPACGLHVKRVPSPDPDLGWRYPKITLEKL